MEKQMEMYELRLHRLEQLTTSMIDSQSTMVQILQEHSNRFDRIESRLDRVEKRLDNVEQRIDNVEKQLELVLTDLAFIKEILLRPK
ncbi:MAG: hypothetical protein OXN94_03085 [Chloroflexota bacterium]|nr:hypothetical protein [Chloroflexota bacterium]MDE2856813.1 hypothetical protein [Chloroflexota bacterium]MDE2951426.1 hypothetical protein [Chloroflexota bacterium]